jgi:hypothetical protein
VYDPVLVNPNDRISNNPNLKAEAALLPQVAALSEADLVTFVTNVETKIEIMGIPDLDSNTGYFYGAKRELCKAPVIYSRILFGGIGNPLQAQYDFLCSLKHERFLKLQRITGAYQGQGKVNRNQLLDAFHLWCAENSKCNFFLSLDFKLAEVIKKSKSKPFVRVVRPSELLAEVHQNLDKT